MMNPGRRRRMAGWLLDGLDGVGQEGEGSMSEKTRLLTGLFVACARRLSLFRPRGWDRWFGRCAAHARWLILICSAMPPWLRVTIICSRPPSLCRSDEQLATMRR